MENYIAAIYCRLSKDDKSPGESMSISNQRAMLQDYCKEQGFEVYDIYIDDGYSGVNFQRPDFQRLMADIELQRINLVITKDLSRLGRDYIMTGYYTEIFFPMRGIRYIAVSDGYDTENSNNDIAPFKNILNDMYAKDISRKVKAAKRQRAKAGFFMGPFAPYGYRKDKGKPGHLQIDSEAAAVVQRIYAAYIAGYGDVRISQELTAKKVLTPISYRQAHRERPPEAGSLRPSHTWSAGMIHHILTNRVYIGEMVNHRKEVVNHKTKQLRSLPEEEHIIVPNTHEAIISQEDFELVQRIRKERGFPKRRAVPALFQGRLTCAECGATLSIAHRVLKEREDDAYRCMRHLNYPKLCTKTHTVYHRELYDYVLSELRLLAKSMKRRMVVSPIVEYADITELTHDILDNAVERIEVGHVRKNSQLRSVITIRWKL